MRKVDKEIKKILKKYERKLGRKIRFDQMESFPRESFSKEYKIFRKEALEKSVSRYENLCNFSEKLLTVKASKKDKEKIQESISSAHLNMTPDGAMSFAFLTGLFIILLGIFIGLISYLYAEAPMFLLPLLLIVVGLVIIPALAKYPNVLANRWRLKASNQMVLCILYVVMYMRHTSNLEHAIKFAGEHIGPPLNLDLRKVFWNIETGKFVNIKESLDNYLENWRKYNLEFVEAFHLIEASLYEPTEERRLKLLEKALEVILEGTYENMMHYAHNLKSPITMLHMLGIILPILGLVIFPLLGSLMGGLIKWWHLMVLYNLILPIFVYSMGSNLLSKRPSGYGEAEITKTHPEFKKFGDADKVLPGFIIILFCFIGSLPITSHYLGIDILDWGYKNGLGPYGIYSVLLSLLIPLGIALGLGLYYYNATGKLIKIKNRTNKLDREFSGGLFQLGNRVGDGIPVEIAFGRVANNMQGTPTGRFFRTVSTNIKRLGMNVKDAIFDSKQGAILNYPSKLIESSMKVLIQAARKGPRVVAKSLITISDYVRRIHAIEERLKDLLADIISSMKSQIKFLTPMIAAIVIAVASMFTTLISHLGETFKEMPVTTAEGMPAVGMEGLAGLLQIKDVVPSFHLQLIVGIYVLEVVFILTMLSTGIEKGVDKITEKNELSKNLLISVGLYTIIAVIGVLIFNVLAKGISTLTATAG